MFSLNKSHAKELVRKHLTLFLKENGFVEKKRRDTSITYRRANSDGFDGLGLGFTEWFPGQKLQFSVYKRINIVEQITEKILAKVDPLVTPIKDAVTVAFGYRTVYKTLNNSHMPVMENEDDVMKSVSIVKAFMEEHGLPLLSKYSSIAELDRTINGISFWRHDWDTNFNLGGNFDIKRIVIAWLNSNPGFEEIVAKSYEFFETTPNPDGSFYKYDRDDLTLRIPYTVFFLKS